MENEELIKEILARESPQIKVDVIRLMEQTNIKSCEQGVQIEKMFREYLIRREMKKYPLNENEQQEIKRKYSESARVVIETEKRLRESEVMQSIVDEYRKNGENKNIIQKFIEMVTGEKSKQNEIAENEEQQIQSMQKRKTTFQDRIKVNAIYNSVPSNKNIIKAKEIKSINDIENEK